MTIPQDPIYCVGCKAAIPPAVPFCPKCGQAQYRPDTAGAPRLKDAPPAPPAPLAAADPPTRNHAAQILGMVAGGIGGLVWFAVCAGFPFIGLVAGVGALIYIAAVSEEARKKISLPFIGFCAVSLLGMIVGFLSAAVGPRKPAPAGYTPPPPPAAVVAISATNTPPPQMVTRPAPGAPTPTLDTSGGYFSSDETQKANAAARRQMEREARKARREAGLPPDAPVNDSQGVVGPESDPFPAVEKAFSEQGITAERDAGTFRVRVYLTPVASNNISGEQAKELALTTQSQLGDKYTVQINSSVGRPIATAEALE